MSFDLEKQFHFVEDPEVASKSSSDAFEGHGDIQALAGGDPSGLKLARDGKTVLIPQPSDDPDDPLNWSNMKKHCVLSSMAFASLLTDFGETYGTVLFAVQAETFGMSIPATANSINGSIFLQGIGGLLAVPLIQRIGRLPVLFYSQLFTALSVMGCAISPGYVSFTTCRCLQGLFNTAPQVVGLTFVHDMFFFHNRVRRVNFWVICVLGGPFVGPQVSGWLITVMTWRADFAVLAGLHAFATLLVVLLGDETLYDRPKPHKREKGVLGKFKCLVGVTGLHAEGRPTSWTVVKDLLAIQIKPQIIFTLVIYQMVLIAWVIGVNVTVSELTFGPPYSFSPSKQALSWIAPLIGAIMGELWGHFFLKWMERRYIARHNGLYVLENRLWGTYPSTIAAICGLVLYGQTFQYTLPWMLILIAWAMIAFAMISSATALSAYCLDSFPKHSSLVASLLNMWRTTGGFCVGFFQLKWIATSGAGQAFGLQAAVLAVAFLVGIVTTQIYGQKWRAKYPPPKAEN